MTYSNQLSYQQNPFLLEIRIPPGSIQFLEQQTLPFKDSPDSMLMDRQLPSLPLRRVTNIPTHQILQHVLVLSTVKSKY